eukprot:jgi/Mesvir1/25030/Mv16969-RA.1
MASKGGVTTFTVDLSGSGKARGMYSDMLDSKARNSPGSQAQKDKSRDKASRESVFSRVGGREPPEKSVGFKRSRGPPSSGIDGKWQHDMFESDEPVSQGTDAAKRPRISYTTGPSADLRSRLTSGTGAAMTVGTTTTTTSGGGGKLRMESEPTVVVTRTVRGLDDPARARGSPQGSGQATVAVGRAAAVARSALAPARDDGDVRADKGYSGNGALRGVAGERAPAPKSGAQKAPKADKEVEQLLVSLGLEKYLSLFVDEEIDMDALEQLEDEDLKELGVPMGPRRKLLSAIRR